jgi:hypothetical protein
MRATKARYKSNCVKFALRRSFLPLLSCLPPARSGMLSSMKKFAVAALFVAASAALPIASLAAAVDPSMIPDGTYVVKVEKVQDPAHLLVMMQNGVETTLVAKNRNFTAVKADDTLKVSLIKGVVPVFQIQ